MIPWETLATAAVPGAAATLKLMRRGGEYSIRLDAAELMNSRFSGSERALAELACAAVAARPAPRLLIGGLGMGFTLNAALAALGPAARIEVAELIPAVVEWARGPMAAVVGDSLADPRVTLTVADVAAVIRAAAGRYDGIALDVDNGPHSLVRAANDALYSMRGLAAARRALRPTGVLAVWSAAPDARFAQQLSQAGFAVEEKRVRANGAGGGARHLIWLARKPA